jgi:DNA-binding transcriptional LysR family regulator
MRSLIKHAYFCSVRRQLEGEYPRLFLNGNPFARREFFETDLCITTAPVEGTDMAWVPLRTEDFYVAVPDNHPLAGRESVSLIELKDETFIGLRTGYWFRSLPDSLCKEAGFTPNTMMPDRHRTR